MNGLLPPRPPEAEPRPDKEPHLHGRSGLAGAGQAGPTSSGSARHARRCQESGSDHPPSSSSADCAQWRQCLGFLGGECGTAHGRARRAPPPAPPRDKFRDRGALLEGSLGLRNFDLGDGAAAPLLACCVRGVLPAARQGARGKRPPRCWDHVRCEPRVPEFPLG
ncbi:hypothetical protein mRhiFer1_008647 [Rhinolophus ferrumequinum]|uniref:Uncharacterized protein n=1 Tax=Rhinolophus ferrumequinum TaxID=59479 RepID=A0A7J7U136_RHIFE|nr:hypothetical protein mRhiFer1_008647 [Rhinolophus ferrumequinum]